MATATPDDPSVLLGELHGELARVLQANHHECLRLSSDATAEQVRQAYLAAVRKYHPHRFSRFGEELEALASEIFLTVKRAYDALLETTAANTNTNTPITTARVRRQRRTSRPSQPPPQSVVRFKRPSQQELSSGAPVRPLTAARTAPRLRPTRHKPGGRAPNPNPSLKPTPTPKPSNLSSRARTSNHTDRVAQLHSEQKGRNDDYKNALQLLRSGRASEARAAFHQLAVALPNKKRYRVYMHYAWGREHHLAGRSDAAAAEYRRALTIDPHFELAAQALDEIASNESAAGKMGVLNRLFRRGR